MCKPKHADTFRVGIQVCGDERKQRLFNVVIVTQFPAELVVVRDKRSLLGNLLVARYGIECSVHSRRGESTLKTYWVEHTATDKHRTGLLSCYYVQEKLVGNGQYQSHPVEERCAAREVEAWIAPHKLDFSRLWNSYEQSLRQEYQEKQRLQLQGDNQALKNEQRQRQAR